MLNKYVVVTAKKNLVPTFDNMAFGFVPENFSEQVQVFDAELNAQEQSDIRRDPKLRALAPAMPMQLIKPLRSEGTTELDGSTYTWGVNAVGALSSAYDGEGVIVAVLDTGINPNHPAFNGVDLIRKNFSGDVNDNDTDGHGTHCAGTIFGRAVDGKRIGVAPGVRRALIGKVLGESGGDSSVIAKAINWASQEGANVISMSLGLDFPNFVKFLVEERELNIDAATSIALEGYRANINLFSGLANYLNAASAFNQGVLLVAAAGNESMRPSYSIAVAPPAASNGFVSVGALKLDVGGKYGIADFSNNQVDIAAPGVDVTSADFRGGLTSLSGTSMATPHVAGVAALWAQRQLKLTGYVESISLAAQVRGSGSMTRIKAGVLESDVGGGLVQAPAR